MSTQGPAPEGRVNADDATSADSGDTQNGRGHWNSRLGFVLAAAGSAVGLGNLWKFPYIAYEYGGGATGRAGAGAFILVYLGAIALIGLPVMMAELLVGRRTQRSPVAAFHALKPRTPWWLAGLLFVVTGFVLLSYYGVVAGWTVEYVGKAATGQFDDLSQVSDAAVIQAFAQQQGLDQAAAAALPLSAVGDAAAVDAWRARILPGQLFGEFVSNPTKQVGFLMFFLLLTMGIVAGGVSGGIERAAKILMPALLVMLVALAVEVAQLGGAGDTLAFLFKPDFSTLTGEAVLEAIGHGFFTLSLGMGAMLVYGSYLPKDVDLPKAALAVSVADTLVAATAAFVMIGAIFSLDLVMEGSGAGNLFVAIPAIFDGMAQRLPLGDTLPLDNILLVVFYVLVAFAALTSTVSLLEVVVSHLIDQRGMKRPGAVLLAGGGIFAFGVLSALSFSVLSDVTFGERGIFDLLDHMVSNWALPLGGLLVAVFVGYGLGQRVLAEELGRDRKALLAVVGVSLRFVAPAAIVVTMIFLLTRG